MKFINNPDTVAASANVNGDPIYAALLLYVSLQANPDGAATGTIKLQASNDLGNPQNNFVPTNWVDIPSATVTLASAKGLIPKTEICYNWIRYVQTGAGAGNVVINVFGQGA